LALNLLVQVFINDTTPSLFVQSLTNGDSFSDFQHQFAVQQLTVNQTASHTCIYVSTSRSLKLEHTSQVNDTILTARVTFGCVLAPLSAALSLRDAPIVNGSVLDVPNGALSIDVRLTNGNTPLCLAAKLQLAPPRVPDGWTST
jgi:hypothetical protein